MEDNSFYCLAKPPTTSTYSSNSELLEKYYVQAKNYYDQLMLANRELAELRQDNKDLQDKVTCQFSAIQSLQKKLAEADRIIQIKTNAADDRYHKYLATLNEKNSLSAQLSTVQAEVKELNAALNEQIKIAIVGEEEDSEANTPDREGQEGEETIEEREEGEGIQEFESEYSRTLYLVSTRIEISVNGSYIEESVEAEVDLDENGKAELLVTIPGNKSLSPNSVLTVRAKAV